MKHYCDTIPLALAEKLKEKGMPIRYEQTDEGVRPATTFGACFDWLLERDIIIHLLYVPKYDLQDGVWRGIVGLDIFEGTWHEAANAAIEKALELIK